MSIAKSVIVNIAYAIVGRGVFRLLASFAMIYALRYFGPERYGILETALAWSNALITLSDIGLSTLIVREAARNKNEASVYYGNTIVVQSIMTLVIFAVLIGLAKVLHYDILMVSMIGLIGAAGLIFEFRKIMQGILRVWMEQKFITFIELINSVSFFITIILLFAFMHNKDSALIGFGIAQLSVNALSIVALQIYTVRYAKPHINLRRIPAMISHSWVFTLYNVFFMLYFQIDQIILSMMSTKTAVGIYGAPSKVAVVLLFVPLMVYQVVLPLMFQYSKNDQAKYNRIAQLLYRYFAAFGVPAGLGLTLAAPALVPFVFGSAYNASIPVMQWMGLFLMVRFFSASTSEILTASDKQHVLVKIQAGGIILNIILDILLIPTYGAVGPAIATFITESLSCIAYFIVTRSLIERTWKMLLLPLFPIAGASIAMSVVLTPLVPRIHVLFSVLIGAVVYGAALWTLRFFSHDDKRLFMGVLKRASTSA